MALYAVLCWLQREENEQTRLGIKLGGRRAEIWQPAHPMVLRKENENGGIRGGSVRS